MDDIYVDHCYAKPWNAHPESSKARQAKFLFVNKVATIQQLNEKQEPIVDVETNFSVQHILSSYDVGKAHVTTNESTGWLRELETTDDWEERIDRSQWSHQQAKLFNHTVKLLTNERIARLANEGHPSEPVLRRLQIDDIARKIRHTLATVNWELALVSWLHNTILVSLNSDLLVIYFDAIQALYTKIPALIDKMMTSHDGIKVPPARQEALTAALKKQPWDVLGQPPRMSPLSHNPVFILIGGALWVEGQVKAWISGLSCMGRVVQVTLRDLDLCTPSDLVARLAGATRAKIHEVRSSLPGRPIVLVGFSSAASIACSVAGFEDVAAVVCVGFPLVDIGGCRSDDSNDPIIDLVTPVLFVTGQCASRCRVADLEAVRNNMKALSGLVVVGGADDYLRLSRQKMTSMALTQDVADRVVMEEVGDFVNGVLMQNARIVGSETDMNRRRSVQVQRDDVNDNNQMSDCSSVCSTDGDNEISPLTSSNIHAAKYQRHSAQAPEQQQQHAQQQTATPPFFSVTTHLPAVTQPLMSPIKAALMGHSLGVPRSSVARSQQQSQCVRVPVHQLMTSGGQLPVSRMSLLSLNTVRLPSVSLMTTLATPPSSTRLAGSHVLTFTAPTSALVSSPTLLSVGQPVRSSPAGPQSMRLTLVQASAISGQTISLAVPIASSDVGLLTSAEHVAMEMADHSGDEQLTDPGSPS